MSETERTHRAEKRAEQCHHGHKAMHGGGGAVYGLGFIGAVIYYLSTATGFWIGVLGILKAIFWPAFVVFSLMQYLHV